MDHTTHAPHHHTPRIVVGFDGSPDSLAALDWALPEARLRDIPVSVHHVWHWPQSHSTATETERVLESAGQDVLDRGVRHAERHTGDVELTYELVRGGPSHQLVEASGDAALVVLGARGQGGFPGLRAGSVNVQVARHAHCPVVVTHADPTGAATESGGQIVVGVDGSAGSDAALAFAFAEAARRQVPVHAVHAWDPDSLLTAAYVSETDLARLREASREKTAEWLRQHTARYSGVDVSIELVHGGPASALMEASAHAALLVLGSRGHGGFATLLLGSVTDTLLHHASCPLVIVRDNASEWKDIDDQ
jgi:nucleotide-binding universal stress UspA family protein